MNVWSDLSPLIDDHSLKLLEIMFSAISGGSRYGKHAVLANASPEGSATELIEQHLC
jgi:hypothetical protein